MKQPKYTPQNEQGMISITVVVVFVMVISLTVLGFSQVTRRNSREALDKQLSSQAFYAAEVGVNDARNKVANLVEGGASSLPNQDNCKGSEYTKDNGKVDEASGVSYSCLLVKTDLASQEYSNVGGGSVVIPLNASAGTLGEPTMKWKPATSSTGKSVSNCKQPKTDGSQPWTNFTSSTSWSNDCPYGVLRIDLTSNNPQTVSSIDTALANTMTIFVYPKSGNVSAPPKIQYKDALGRVAQGRVVAAACNNTECSLQLSGLDFQKAYMRVRSVYLDTQMFEVEAQRAAIGGGYAYTFDSQVEIDATGKAQDVLRRIKVRVSKSGGTSRTDLNNFSDYALQSADSICKRFISSPVLAKVDSAVSTSCN